MHIHHRLRCLLMLAGMLPFIVHAQDTLPSAEKPLVRYTFRATEAINGPTTETLRKNKLLLSISHRFYGTIDDGIDELFGMDQFANIRFGFLYGITDRLSVNVGRTRVGPMYDGSIKYKLLRQRRGGLPISVTVHANANLRADEWTELEQESLSFRHRWSYASQVLISSKVTPTLSLQLMPTLIHRNLTLSSEQANTNFALGGLIWFRASTGITLMLEYYQPFPEETTPLGSLQPIWGFSVNFLTASHSFQLQFTNATLINMPSFMMGTTDDFFNRGIHIGFNILRTFNL